MTPLTAGTCATCQAEVWVAVRHPMTSERVLLYPRPDSVYANVMTPHGRMVGVAFCAEHAPPVASAWDDGLVESVDPAPERYAARYAAGYGVFLRAWLADELRCDEAVIAAVLGQWASDRVEALHG